MITVVTRPAVTLWSWGIPSGAVDTGGGAVTPTTRARLIHPHFLHHPDALTGWLLFAAMLWAAVESLWRR